MASRISDVGRGGKKRQGGSRKNPPIKQRSTRRKKTIPPGKKSRGKIKKKALIFLLPLAFLLLILENLSSVPKRQQPPIERTKLGNPQVRFLIVWAVLIVGGLALSANLYRLQVLQGSDLQQQARRQQNVALRPFIPRRPIVDRMGNVVALDRRVYQLYAHPYLFKDSKEAIAARLAPLLQKSVGELYEKLTDGDSGILLEPTVSEELANRIRNQMIDGLELNQYQQRYYPQQNLVADVVGYVDTESEGQAGVEASHQNLLEREAPMEIDSRIGGALIPDPVPGEFLRLDDLRLELTLDLRLQRATRLALEEHRRKWSAKRGTVIVFDAHTGEILALACDPSYDPNAYYKFNVELFKNWALTDLYEPGSTFKPIAVAIALEAGAIEPDSVFYDEGLVYIDEWPISNADGVGRGNLSVTEIIRYSSNVGMVHIVEQLRSRVFYSWLQRLGLGEPLGTDLPFETPSQLRSREEFSASPVNAATASFGQGISLTPLQLVQIHGALANGGYLVTPHVVRGLFDSEGQAYWKPEHPPRRQVFSQETTDALISMMESVVQDGTGTTAQIPGYRIAGKTGTSQKANLYGGGYSDYARIASFVGIIPAQAPRYVVLAVMDEPQGGSGGQTAAPVVKSVMETLIAIEGIPPSE
ncbi:peptidoglycan D,D-transpeptidase FtsI family protein [Phormidium sp. CCY1219]|uniref:peptidoglycan D,D-transpeptidase FtsI family protein n=1 Tax=Phormidium sp. CCY1219 TaxID=2886104 RepID=UPI002D1EE6A7|nr:penicillin-binding protein 2 [Phormidium sp. CCY1219]MEB3829373.1 penicillin-binding protein 2 [Phormidium sp. CCY1219]